MGLLSRLLGAASQEELDGIRLDEPTWELAGPRTFSDLFAALRSVLPADAVLYFEGGTPDQEISAFLATYAVPERAHVAFGTIWPRPKVAHVPVSEEVFDQLVSMMERHAEPELAIHFHVYRESEVLLQWYDAFSLPIWLSDWFTEEQVASMAGAMGTSYHRAA